MTLKQLKSLMLVTFSAAVLSQASAADVKVSGSATGYIKSFSSSTKAAEKDAKSKSVSKWVHKGSGAVKFSAEEQKGSTTYSAVVSGEGYTGEAFKLDDTYLGISMDSGLTIKYGGVRGSGVDGSFSVGESVEAKGGADYYFGQYARQRKGAVIAFATGDIHAELALVTFSQAKKDDGTAELNYLGFRPYFKFDNGMIHADFAYDTITGESTDEDDKDKDEKSGFGLNVQYSGAGVKAGFNYGSGEDSVTAYTPAAKATTKKVNRVVADGDGFKEEEVVVPVAEVKASKKVTKKAPVSLGVYAGYEFGSGMAAGINYKATTDVEKVETDAGTSETNLATDKIYLGFSHNVGEGPVTYYVTYATSTATSEAQKNAKGEDISEKFKYEQKVDGITFKMSYDF